MYVKIIKALTDWISLIFIDSQSLELCDAILQLAHSFIGIAPLSSL